MTFLEANPEIRSTPEIVPNKSTPPASPDARPLVASIREATKTVPIIHVVRIQRPEPTSENNKSQEVPESTLIAMSGINPEAFGELYSRYHEDINRYITNFVGNPTIAEDLTENVFLKAYAAILDNKYVHQEHLKAWLFRIARNTCSGFYRKSETRKEGYLNPEIVITGPEHPEQDILLSERNSMLVQLVDHLNPLHRKIVIMRFVEGLSFAQIAQEIGKTEANTRVLLHRTIKRLQKKIAKQGLAEDLLLS